MSPTISGSSAETGWLQLSLQRSYASGRVSGMRIKETLSPRSLTLCVPEAGLSSGFCSFHLFLNARSWSCGRSQLVDPHKDPRPLIPLSLGKIFNFTFLPHLTLGGFHPSVQSCLPATGSPAVAKGSHILTGSDRKGRVSDIYSWGSQP